MNRGAARTRNKPASGWRSLSPSDSRHIRAGKGAAINFYIWCAVGAGAGWLAGVLMGSRDKLVRVEEILVGIFGAFIGGEVIPANLPDPRPGGFTVLALSLAVGAAAVMLLLLRLLRRAVGPMRSGKKPAARR